MDSSYTMMNKLGKGGFAKVIEVVMNGKHLAMKKLNRTGPPGSDTVKEVVMLKDTESSALTVSLEGLSTDGRTRIFLELASQGSLSKFIKKTKQTSRMKLLPQVVKFFVSILHELHKYGIVHYDIKPGNVLVFADGTMKLADFGLAQYSSQSTDQPSREKVYSKWYRAPEYASQESTKVSYAGDIWAAGMSILQFILGRPLFRPRDNDELIVLLQDTEQTHPTKLKTFIKKLDKSTLKGKLDINEILDFWDITGVPRSTVKLLGHMLQFDPMKRFKAVKYDVTQPVTRTFPFSNPVTNTEKRISDLLHGTEHGVWSGDIGSALMKYSL
jgi:serine/threonine protein kinase